MPTRSSLELQDSPFFTQWYLRYGTDTFQYYVQDKLSFGALTVDLGWKGFSVVNTATPIIAGGYASGRIKVQDYFQPHAGVNYRLTNGLELCGDFTEVKRAFTSAATSGPFATTQAGFNALLTTSKLKPESSNTYEAGGRFHRGPITALAAGYYVDFQNRTLAQTVGAGIVGNPAILSNVGSVRAYGVETALEAKLYRGFGLFASYSYNDSTYRQNVTVNGVAEPIRGKQTVDTPKNLAKGEITYDGTRFFGRVGADYLSRRYFTYTNDQSVPGRVLVDATIGVRMELGDRKFEIQGNATNLFNKRYVATIGSNGFGYSGDNQTLLAGAPRELFVSVKTTF